MATKRVRDLVLNETAEEIIRRRTEEGWRIVTIEWERDAPGVLEDRQLEPVPFGFRIAGDCLHLEADPIELQVLTLVTGMIVQERRLSAISEALNQSGYRTRDGQRWTPVTVFELMPRIVESGPRIFANPNWPVGIRAARP
jgi:hypothetical protein